MIELELRDQETARRFIEQGLWLSRAAQPHAGGVKPALEWALEVASTGQPLPPLGFLADLGTVLYVAHPVGRQRETPEVPGVPIGLIRTYEDHVLGKFLADWSFERAGDALRRYVGRDRARGLAFVVEQFRERASFGGVHLSPAIVRSVLERPAEAVLSAGFESLSRDGPLPLILELYEALISAARRCAEVLGPEDLFELEHGTALADMGQRVALRQVLKAANVFEESLPLHRPRTQASRAVPTRIFDEDVYPVGGYSSLSNRGSIESLLHSQLAYMEQDDAERPDLFDIKFLRDELLYYARDENQFLRRRRTFVFALYPDLAQARFKDPDFPWQRGILMLGLLIAGLRKLVEWLSDDSLHFEFLFLTEGAQDAGKILEEERELLGLILREQIANSTVSLATLPADELADHCARLGRRSLCHCLLVSCQDRPQHADDTESARLILDGPIPGLGFEEEELTRIEADSGVEAWCQSLARLVEAWL